MIEIKAKNFDDLKLIEKARMMYESLKNDYNAIMNADEVARLIGVKESTIRQWTYKNMIPHRKISGFVRYMLSDIIFWLITNKNEIHKKRGRPRKEESLKKAGII